MIKLGIICPSEIAFRRFMPSLLKVEDSFQFVGIAIASPEEWFGETSKLSAETISKQQESEHAKAQTFIDKYGGHLYYGYSSLISSSEIDAVYMPLPPALHFRWAKLALHSNKHVFLEKPSTTSINDTNKLIGIASDMGLALHENYMFIFHNQLNAINEVIASGEIGEIRLYRIAFGFPIRQEYDFRYNKILGGGALLDAGGYCLKYANYLLGDSATVITAQANNIEGFEVEMFGSATISNDMGTVAQIAFGMDNDYKCDVEIWGSKGTINSNRIFTAPTGFLPTYTIKKNQSIETRLLPADDAFLKSILHFKACVLDKSTREDNFKIVQKQGELIEQFKTIIKFNK